jgi:hypothetical protein
MPTRTALVVGDWCSLVATHPGLCEYWLERDSQSAVVERVSLRRPRSAKADGMSKRGYVNFVRCPGGTPSRSSMAIACFAKPTARAWSLFQMSFARVSV